MKPFTSISREHLESPLLSAEAKVVLMMIIARLRAKPDWIVRDNEFASCLKEGRDQVRRALKELRQAGLIHQEKIPQGNRQVWSSPQLAPGVDPHSQVPAAETQPLNKKEDNNTLLYMSKPYDAKAKPSLRQDLHENENQNEEVFREMTWRLEQIASRLQDLSPSTGSNTLLQFTARSPIRHDTHSSFSIGIDSKSLEIVFKDHGFSGRQKDLFNQVVAWSGKPPSYFFPPHSGEGRTVFTYLDESGEPVARKIKQPSTKSFRWQHLKDGKWTKGKGGHRILYNLPEVQAAVKEGRRIFIVEGEKDVETLRSMGEVATTPMDGAGSWSKAFSRIFDGADVIIIRDFDEAGQLHARHVYDELSGARTRKLCVTGVGNDISDHIAAGETLEDLREDRATLVM